VRRPAIYELRDEKPLLDLVRVAAGSLPPPGSSASWWSGSREIHPASSRRDRGGPGKRKATVDLTDGDIVRVFPILPVDVNGITLEGTSTARKYELKPGMTVGSLLKDAMDFRPETYFDYALLTRLSPGPAQGGHPGKPPGDRAGEEAGADVALQGRTSSRSSTVRPSATRPRRPSPEVRMTRQPPDRRRRPRARSAGQVPENR